MEIALYLLVGITSLMIICLTIIIICVYWKNGQAMRQTIQKLVQDEFALRLCTVFVIVFLTAFLALSKGIDNIVATIFSGIAGYVLGGIKKNIGDNEKSSENVD